MQKKCLVITRDGKGFYLRISRRAINSNHTYELSNSERLEILHYPGATLYEIAGNQKIKLNLQNCNIENKVIESDEKDTSSEVEEVQNLKEDVKTVDASGEDQAEQEDGTQEDDKSDEASPENNEAGDEEVSEENPEVPDTTDNVDQQSEKKSDSNGNTQSKKGKNKKKN